MAEGHVDFPYVDVAPDCSCCYGNDWLGVGSEIADVDSGYNVVGVNRNLVRVTLGVLSAAYQTTQTDVS